MQIPRERFISGLCDAYPFMYLFYAWLIKEQLFTLEQTWLAAVCIFIWNIVLAYLMG